MKYPWAVLVMLMLAIVGCAPGPMEVAKANAVQEETNIQSRNADLDLEIRKANAQAQIDAERAKIDNDRKRAEAQAVSIVETARLQAVAEQGAITARGLATARVLDALSIGGKFALIALGAGLGIAIVLVAGGRSAAYAINSVLTAQYVRIGVEPQTLLPPPLVITVDGYLIDTRSGERARIRDAAGVSRLRLAATTQTANTALMARAAVEIGKANRGKSGDGVRAAEALPTIVAGIPLLDTGEESE